MINESRIKKLAELRKQYDTERDQIDEITKQYRLIQKEAIINCLRIMEENRFFSEDGLKLLNTGTTRLGTLSPHESLLDFRGHCKEAINKIDQLYPDQEVKTE